MYIEVLHDNAGRIMACYCADTLPSGQGAVLSFTGVPQGFEHARLNIDTLTAMEIENCSGPKAVIDPANGQPVIEETDRTRYVMDNFEVDLSRTDVLGGVSLRGVRRKL
jgi:hypothetical protein